MGSTDALVAAKQSTLPALAMTASTTENKKVKATIPRSLAVGECIKKRAYAESVGNREDRIVLRMSMTA